MEELNRCLELRRNIMSLEERIEDIEGRIRFPKSQTLSDMPRGSSSGTNPIERYIVLKEKYQSQKLLHETELSMIWNDLDKRMVMCGVPQDERRLMYLRYNSGLSWKKCTAIMREIEGKRWNENRTFKTNRKVLKAINECEL